MRTWTFLFFIALQLLPLLLAYDDNSRRAKNNTNNDAQMQKFKSLFPGLDAEKFFRVRTKLSQVVLKEVAQVVGKLTSVLIPKLVSSQIDDKSIWATNQKSGMSDLLYEGDAVLSNAQLDSLEQSLDSSIRSKRQAFNVNNWPQYLWANRTIYYFFGNVSETNKISFQIAAKEFWEANTCLTLTESSTAPNALEVISGQGCWSYIGMNNGHQILSLGDGCETTTVHELGHALGLFHSQSRYDRNGFLTIDLSNVDPTQVHNYDKQTPENNDNLQVGYDYGSVMQYDAPAFAMSRSGTLPMTPKDLAFLYTMGNDRGSFNDIVEVNRMYGCESICVGKPNLATCGNGGIPHPKNCSKCLCPRAYTGEHCGQPTKDTCGTILKSTATVTTFKKTVGEVMSSYQYRPRECTVHIKAPVGQKVEVTLKNISDPWPYYGCRFVGVEMKARKEPRYRGIIYCCDFQFGQKVVSETNEMPVIFFTTKGVHTFEITYRTVPASTPSTTTYKIS